MRHPIVVGVDGSAAAAGALRWAVEEGRRRQLPVTAVLVWSYLDQHDAAGGEGFDPTYGEDDARAALHAFVVAAVGEGSEVRQEVVCDSPVPAIAELSEVATMVVLGATGDGGFLGLRLGSTSDTVLHRSAAPVVIVRGEGGAGPVIVGIDDSPEAARVLRWGVEEARLRGRGLVAASAWLRPVLANWAFEEDAPYFATLAAHRAEALAATVAEVDTSGVVVEQRVVAGSAAGALLALEQELDASLLVVGARGMPAAVGALLGSVSRQVTHHATGPVLVVRP
jgi:nucleotide-binding universal stress UspA family protein